MKDTLVITATRNEGPFLLEWLAWYRMLGFSRALVMHNDCTDHSPQLLRLLERHGFLAQKNVRPDPARPPQPQSLIAAGKHPLVREAEWAFVCDPDEFLVIHKGEGTLTALLDGGDLPFAGLLINWRIFGTAGHALYSDDLTHRRFLRAAKPDAPQNNCFKTLFRAPRDWGRLRAHGPRFWRGNGAWGEGANRFARANGQVWPGYDPDIRGEPPNSVGNDEVTLEWAQLNHYALRSREQFAFKKGRPSAAMLEDRYTDLFFKRFDRNECADERALAYRERFDRAWREIAEAPGVLRLHHLCCADYVAAMCEKRGDDPKADPRYIHHRKLAAALPRHAPAGS